LELVEVSEEGDIQAGKVPGKLVKGMAEQWI